MKSIKRILTVLLALALSLGVIFSLSACGECTHADTDGDGKCDKCNTDYTAPIEDVTLVDTDGTPKFQFVLADSVGEDIERALADFARALGTYGVEIDIAEDTESTAMECEVLIGDVKSRGEKYDYDEHSLGKEGYVIKIVGQKIIVNAGSIETLMTTVDTFIKDVLGYESGDRELYPSVMTADMQIEVPQSDYRITGISVNGVDIKDYTIATNTASDDYIEAALYLQDAIYSKTGYWLDIVPVAEADSSIIIKEIPKKTGNGSFKIYTNDDNQLIVECAYSNRLYDSMVSFFIDNVSIASGVVNLEGDIMSADISVVYYEDFGARGDGKTDDFAAIKKAHDVANEGGQTVKSKNPSKATYYLCSPIINGEITTIVIKTNVDWGGAKFIVDDTNLECRSSVGVYVTHLIEVKPDYEPITITDKAILDKIVEDGIDPDTTKIDLGLGYPAMIFPSDSTQSVYRRKGYGGYRGYPMSEAIVIDENGNVDPSTAPVFTYTNLTAITVYRADEAPITIENATFTTKSSRFNAHVYNAATGTHYAYDTNYFNRGIDITRSNTVLKNVDHYIEGEFTLQEQLEGKIGVVYYGFFQVHKSNNVTIDSCIMTARRCFWRGVAWAGGDGTQGTYDLLVQTSNNVLIKDCVQSNFWVNDNAQAVPRGSNGAKLSICTSTVFDGFNAFVKMYWGIAGSNDTKNLEYNGCTLNRFDAHRGLYNGKIIDCTITDISLDGGGEFIMENVEWFSPGNGKNENGIIILRDDYGSTWDGTITMKNIKAYPDPGRQTDNPDRYWNFWIATHIYTNWDFGYKCAFPSIYVENLSVYDRTTITKTNLDGQKIAPGSIYISLTCGYSYVNVPGIHEDTVTPPEDIYKPWYMYEDKDRDGYVDNTGKDAFGNDILIPFDASKEIRNGIQASVSDVKNLNPITPPEFLIFKNTDGHTIYLYENLPFLSNTYIEVDGVVKNDPAAS